jgi:hypothetical protein
MNFYFRRKSLDTNEFRKYFVSHFGEEINAKIDWESWIN